MGDITNSTCRPRALLILVESSHCQVLLDSEHRLGPLTPTEAGDFPSGTFLWTWPEKTVFCSEANNLQPREHMERLLKSNRLLPNLSPWNAFENLWSHYEERAEDLVVSLSNLNKPRRCIKKQRHDFADKGPSSQSYVFSRSHMWM